MWHRPLHLPPAVCISTGPWRRLTWKSGTRLQGVARHIRGDGGLARLNAPPEGPTLHGTYLAAWEK